MGKDNVDNKGKFFEQDDNLGRDRYAEFLKSLIINSDKYKRDSDTESYVIALDSGWGTGKSYFLSMFKNYLNGNKSSESSYEGFKDEIKIIEFNAWKNDFWNNAFEPFMSSLMDSEALELEADNERAEKLLKGIGSAAAKIAKGFVKQQVVKLIGNDVTNELVKEAADIFDTEASGKIGDFVLGKSNIFPEYREFKSNIEQLKTMLTEYIDTIDGKYKLVIIIDELDRCKPTFAIELLEIVKHLFDIKGLVFIFAVDIEQLSCSIRTVYGHEMDATGYLCRFFDYISRMPKPDTGVYIKNRIELLKEQNKLLYKRNKLMDIDKIEEFINDLVVTFQLSLRDIDTILITYNIMLNTFLMDYIYYEAHCKYLYFVTLKYKSVRRFNDIFFREISEESVDKITEKNKWLECDINFTDKVFENESYSLFKSRNSPPFLTSNSKVSSVVQNKINLSEYKKSDLKIDNGIRLDNLLYKPDILKWEKIKNLKYGQYIHQQLEMFDFVDAEQKR